MDCLVENHETDLMHALFFLVYMEFSFPFPFQLKVGYSFLFYRTRLCTLVEGIVLSQCLHPREFYADNNL